MSLKSHIYLLFLFGVHYYYFKPISVFRSILDLIMIPMHKIITIALLVFIVRKVNGHEKTQTVTLNHGGKVQGTTKILLNGDSVDEYLGIPYAEPPTESKRFKAPAPAQPWTHILNASSMPKSCYQVNHPEKIAIDMTNGRPDIYDVNEDCLYLNIWVPRNASQKLPVMFFIHGGSFMKGSSAQNVLNGRWIAGEAKAVVVTFNYRLAMFGFLYSGDQEAPGNMGILDQLEALKWVATNIRNFGGDPNQITVVGNSAGAASAGILALSDRSRGFFQRAIMQSGVPNAPWSRGTPANALASTVWLARQVNCTTESVISTEVMNCLREVDAATLIRYTTKPNSGFDLLWKPVVDGEFIKSDPEQLLKQGNLTNNSIIIGTTSNEAGAYVGRQLASLAASRNAAGTTNLDAIFSQIVSSLFPSSIPPQYLLSIVTNIRNLYGPKGSPFDQASFVLALNNLASDYYFNCAADRFAKYAVKSGNTVFRYVYDHMASTKVYPSHWGVVHTADLPLMFCNPLNEEFKDSNPYTEAEIKFCKDIAHFWTNFLTKGNPNDELNNDFLWPMFNVTESSYLDLKPQMAVARDHRSSTTCGFWEHLLTTLGQI